MCKEEKAKELPETRTRVGAVIPVFGQFDFAYRTVTSLIDSVPDATIVMVDDCSTDELGWTYLVQSLRHHNVATHRFHRNKGITRGWNFGAEFLLARGCSHVLFANSDLVFPRQFLPPLLRALAAGRKLVGPLTNAPGHVPEQNVRRYLTGYQLSDAPDLINTTQCELARFGNTSVDHKVNGFCFLTTANTLIANRYNSKCFFNPAPRFRMIRNEDEFQGRLFKMYGAEAAAIVLSSFVFHYRGVTRGINGSSEGWFRPA